MEEYNEKHLREFSELLQIYRSDDAKKSRRNVSLIGFTIIVVHVLGIKLTEIKVLGIDISKAKEIWVLWISIALVLYWLVVATVFWIRDRTIQKERELVFNDGLRKLEAKYKENENWKFATEGSPRGSYPYNYGGIKSAYENFLNQKSRTRLGRWGELVIAVLEVFVPTGLGLGALYFLTYSLLTVG